MSEQPEFKNLLEIYAAPVADNGFTAAALARIDARAKWRLPTLITAGIIGGILAASQIPSLWKILSGIEIPAVSPLALTAFGVFGFVVWAALDRGWSDTV